MLNIQHLTDAWVNLNKHIFLRPIRTDSDYVLIRVTADRLADEVGDDENHPLFSMFDIVLTLIEHWEKRNVVIPDVPPKEVLRFLLEQEKLLQKDLIGIASESLISDILNGRRVISKKLAKRLAERFNVDVSVFI